MTSLLALTGNNTLVSFESTTPNDIESIAITGVDGILLGVDTRPANGMVYGITDTNKIYTIDPDTGMATQISTLDMPFNATAVTGFDFNPVADRLRLVGDNEQDFRINVDTGAVTVDGDLAFAADDFNAGDDPSITAAAYTNSFAGTTSTTLYDIDQAQDILVLQDPPNDGVLKTIGELGVDFGGTGGFDIAYTPAGTNEAFAISNDMLYAIDLGMGSATPLGMVDSQGSHFRGLTARGDLQIDPIAQKSQFLALTSNDKLVSFDPSRPDKTTTININGLDGSLLGIDTRPSNGLIYGITTENTVYTINPNTGDATKVSTLDVSFEGTTVSGFDFNPVADRLRLVGDNDQDFRINVETGAVTIDGDLAFAAGDVNAGANPKVTAAAYTNAIANPTTTKLYDIDTDLDTLVLQNPPNDGTLMTIGELGTNFGELAGFDIVSSGEGHNAAFAVEDSTLYSIDLETGLATRIGAIDTDMAAGMGTSVAIKGLATVDASTIVDPIANNSAFLALSDDGKIASFVAGNPMAVTEATITGLGDGETLLGFDMRPANGMVYGITDADKIYTLDPRSGMATFVSQLDMPFNATTVSGFDFNPVADRLRLVGDNEQDFRINVDTGAVTVDGDLAYAAGDANAGFNPKVTAAAYTNSIAAPTATQLYDIDTDLDALVLQNPPNDGTLMTIGELGVNFDELAGFDIVSPSQGSNAAFAVSNGMLYSIDLMTGEASSLGKVGDGSSTYSGLTAVDSNMIAPIDPIANNSRFLALSDNNTIASFDPGNPKAVRSIDITGLGSGETLLGFDTRPANGLIYGITDADTIYTIDPNSGMATMVSMLDMPFNATTISGFDFNPVADRLRLVGDNDQDFRINVDTGAVTVDGDLAYAMGDMNEGMNPTVTAAAYTNAVASPTATQLYDIDIDLDVLVLQNPPNDGTLMTIGELGVDFDTLGGFDIISPEQGSNAGFAVSNGMLYSIDLLTGEASSLGKVGDADSTYVGLATVSNDVIEPTTVAVKADAEGLTTAVAYDVTAANRVSADLGNDPAMASDAAFDNYVGFYEVSGLSGGIDTNGDGTVDLAPGDEGYAATAIGRRLDNFVIRTGGNPDNDTTNDSFNPVVLTGGKFYAPFIIANLGDTTPEDFLTNNPNNSAATQFDDQVAYFSFVEANPDSAIHLKSLGSSTMGGSPVFGFEDLPGNLGVSDNDFNDAVFAVDFTVV